MRIRPYTDCDFEIVARWIPDERTHALWCARLIPYPLEKSSFEEFLFEMHNRYQDKAFVAITDSGDVIGFFCLSVNQDTKVGMLKFVVVDDATRGKGYGSEMLSLAVKHAFESENMDAVQLNVFSENMIATRCYEKVGFQERSLTENAFVFGEEAWGRCNMVLKKEDDRS